MGLISSNISCKTGVVSLQMLSSLFTHVKAGIIVANSEKRIVMANQYFCKMLGYLEAIDAGVSEDNLLSHKTTASGGVTLKASSDPW